MAGKRKNKENRRISLYFFRFYLSCIVYEKGDIQ